MLTAAQLPQRRGTWWCQTPARPYKAEETESAAKACLAITFISPNEPSECFQALSISSWRQRASIRSQTRGVQVKSRGGHKTQGVWQQLNPLLRNRLLLLLWADGQTQGNSRLQWQFLKGKNAEGFFPITFKSCSQTFTEDCTLHEHLIPSLILLATGFLTARKIHPGTECYEPFYPLLLSS